MQIIVLNHKKLKWIAGRSTSGLPFRLPLLSLIINYASMLLHFKKCTAQSDGHFDDRHYLRVIHRIPHRPLHSLACCGKGLAVLLPLLVLSCQSLTILLEFSWRPLEPPGYHCTTRTIRNSGIVAYSFCEFSNLKFPNNNLLFFRNFIEKSFRPACLWFFCLTGSGVGVSAPCPAFSFAFLHTVVHLCIHLLVCKARYSFANHVQSAGL